MPKLLGVLNNYIDVCLVHLVDIVVNNLNTTHGVNNFKYSITRFMKCQLQINLPKPCHCLCFNISMSTMHSDSGDLFPALVCDTVTTYSILGER